MPKAKLIGVFDSGLGGQSVVEAIQIAFPQHNVLFKNDRANMPYGQRTPESILKLIEPIFQELVASGCDVIVIACNTVSTTLYEQLKQMFVLPLIAMVPMVKPAAQLTNSKVIAVCATPTTLSSTRYAELKRQYAADIKVIEPDCSDWSLLIEDNRMNAEYIEADLRPAIEAGADVIVLGCTHYHWIEQEIVDLVGPKITVLQPEPAVISQLSRLLARLP